MSDGLTVEFDVHFGRAAAGQRKLREGREPATPVDPLRQAPRISRLMALAIRCDELIRSGEIADYAELARLGHITRARMSQIMNLLNLAPYIQEEILFLPPTVAGRDSTRERDIRGITQEADWRRQREQWHKALAY